MPAEWFPHECCWMQWPTETFPTDVTSSWSHFDYQKGRDAWANVANAISKFEKTKMIVHPEDSASAKSLLSEKIDIIEFPINDACLLYTSPSPRDYAASRMPSSA